MNMRFYEDMIDILSADSWHDGASREALFRLRDEIEKTEAITYYVQELIDRIDCLLL